MVIVIVDYYRLLDTHTSLGLLLLCTMNKLAYSLAMSLSYASILTPLQASSPLTPLQATLDLQLRGSVFLLCACVYKAVAYTLANTLVCIRLRLESSSN